MSVAFDHSREPLRAAPGRRAYIIVFGNEKGGTGKTTTAVHVAVSLLCLGKRVAAIDLDGRQQTFARYIENRTAFAERTGIELPIPDMQIVSRSRATHGDAVVADESERLELALKQASRAADYIVLDTPGSDTNLSRLGHAAADSLFTPLNDSFLDFDLLATIDPESLEIEGPSLYSEFVWECRKRRVLSRRPAIDWVVARNRVSPLDARNKKRIAAALDALSERMGFRIARGLSERVIYRELFHYGLTLFDLPLPDVPVVLTMSHVSARQEMRDLLGTLQLPGLERAAAAG